MTYLPGYKDAVINFFNSCCNGSKSYNDIARLFNISKTTVYRWLNINSQKIKKQSKPWKITQEIKEFVKSSLENSTLEIKEMILSTLKVSISRQSISNIIKDLGWTRKKRGKQTFAT